MNTTSGLGLGLLSQTLYVTVDLGLSQCYRSSRHVSARSFMTLVKFTWSVSSLISILKGSVQRTGSALYAVHINLRCTLSALASRVECVLGAVVYVSCPQLVSLLVVFACFFFSPSRGP